MTSAVMLLLGTAEHLQRTRHERASCCVGEPLKRKVYAHLVCVMKNNLHRVLFGSSSLLILASLATGHYGVQYEINKIPPETRAAMRDFDWIGVE